MVGPRGIELAGEFRQPGGEELRKLRSRTDDQSTHGRNNHLVIDRFTKGDIASVSTDRVTNMEVAYPGQNRLAAGKAWIKSAYLVIGAATQGEAWTTSRGKMIREYLLEDGSDRQPPASARVVGPLPQFESLRWLFRGAGEDEDVVYVMVWSGMVVSFGNFQDVGEFYAIAIRESVRLPVPFGPPRWTQHARPEEQDGGLGN